MLYSLPVQDFRKKAQQSNLEIGICVSIDSVVCLHHNVTKWDHFYIEFLFEQMTTYPSLFVSVLLLLSPEAILRASLVG